VNKRDSHIRRGRKRGREKGGEGSKGKRTRDGV